jgi:hypothetical protein
MTQPENQIRRGRWKLVGVHEVEGYEGRGIRMPFLYLTI